MNIYKTNSFNASELYSMGFELFCLFIDNATKIVCSALAPSILELPTTLQLL
jgi:hypothetical protein